MKLYITAAVCLAATVLAGATGVVAATEDAGTATFNPQPDPPGIVSANFNPQPDPPGRRVSR